MTRATMPRRRAEGMARGRTIIPLSLCVTACLVWPVSPFPGPVLGGPRKVRAGAARTHLRRGGSGEFTAPWIARRPLRFLAELCANTKPSEGETKATPTESDDPAEYHRMPSVVSWLQPTCFLQSRPKETMFKAWVPNIQGASRCGTMTARHSTGSHWYGLGCSEDEFKHVVLSAKAPIETPIKKLRVDLGSEDVCSGLRDKWADGRLFLKDLGTSDLDCTSSATKSRDETLLDTIVDNWNHLRHFREDADHMTPVEMRQWLQEWQASSEAGKEPEASEGPWTGDWVRDCSFDPERSIDQTGQFLQPLLRWFNGAYPYYQQQCTVCGSEVETHLLATTKASPLEQTFEATRTEIYRCFACASYYRVPRYNQIRKILEEGRGRCGEYSMVFYHLLSALGYKARWIVDWSDHCWIEIEICGVWVHMDPSVAVWDDKDMYKRDWHKQHMFVLAFRHSTCEDVTEAYADSMVLARQRRNLPDNIVVRLLVDSHARCGLVS